jgi:hypothetical protein
MIPAWRIDDDNDRFRRVDTRTARDIWKFKRPYGVWICKNSRQVLFNRFYIPILERYAGERSKPANPNEWVEWISQRWFYSDSTPHEVISIIVDAVLEEWGQPPLPRRVDGPISGLSSIDQRRLPNPYNEGYRPEGRRSRVNRGIRVPWTP